MSTIEDVCKELKKFGIFIDPHAIRASISDPDSLARIERNLWEMLRAAETENQRRRV